MKQRVESSSSELGRSSAKLDDQRSLARNSLVLALLALLLALPTALWSSRVAVVLGIAAVVEVGVASFALLRRRDLVERLALDPEAYAIPDVHKFGSRLTSPAERQRLATWIREMIRDAPLPASLYLAERVAAHREELEFLARDFASPQAVIHPSSAAACLRALASPVESPFYNYQLPADEVPVTLNRIRRGIGRSVLSGAG